MVHSIYEDIIISANEYEYEANRKKIKNSNIVSLLEFRDQVSQLDYKQFDFLFKFYKERNMAFENYKIPNVFHTYLYLFVKNSCVPTCEEVFNAYVEKYVNVFANKYFGALYNKYKPNGKDLRFRLSDLKKRILRTYTSFHRKLDLLLSLIEYNEDNKYIFSYSFLEDLEGSDIIVYDEKGNRFDISISYNSGESINFGTSFFQKINPNKIIVIANLSGENCNVFELNKAFLFEKKVIKEIFEELDKRTV